MAKHGRTGVTIRPASVEDVPAVYQLTLPFVEQRKLLRRSEDDLRELVPNGFVADDQGTVVGFAAVEIYSKKLAELQCLAVDARYQGQGLGKRLVQACVARAKEQNVLELMAITAMESFFQDCGFDYSLPDQKRALFINTRPRR